MLNPQRIDQIVSGRGLSRRAFVTTTVGGAVGLALLPGIAVAQDAKARPGSRPTEQPLAFVNIAKDGTTTILCNRMDMGQGIETGLAMICAEELDADWSQVRTGFGDQKGEYVDPLFGIHLTGGSNSVKNSYQQYRELGARAKAMLVAAAAQSWGMPASSLKAENGVISGGGRSAGYGEFFDAAMKLPVPEAVTLKDPKSFRRIGQPTTLTVAKAKSTGTQAYGMDVQLPGMVVAVIQRPPVFNGKVAKLDSSEALKVKGVKAVLPVTLDRGGQGVAVVASGYWAAKKGRDALKIAWDLAGTPKPDTAALTAQYLALARTPGTPAPKPELQADASAWSKAPKKIVADFVFPYLNHAQMEPLACTVDLKADRCDFYYASQMPGIDAMNLAKAVGLKPEQVQIHVLMAGGGFGRRATPATEWPREAAAVAVALAQAGQPMPVKVIWSREDDMKAGYYRPMTVHRAEIGFDAAGKVVGWQHRIVSQSILKGSPLEGFGYQKGVDGTSIEGMREPYELPMNLSVHHPDVNVPVLWWRSVGSTHTAYVMETLVDEIAFATQQDPVAYRMKLMEGNAKAERHRQALQAAVDKSGYGKRKLKAGQAWGVALHESFESVVAYVVVASLKGKGKDRRPVLEEVHAGVHCNLCVNPRAVETQVQGAAIMALGTTMPTHRITFKDGVVEQGNFQDVAMPRMPDAPKVMTVSIVPSNDPPKGMGEPGLPALAPALANAVARLTGQRQRELPFRFA
ncbi:xanthine dehydrogenase family protein molybdopterin-binding subunit [Roseateles saccharophilus]|uniref:Isoquinoline 1-oxidoreductase beta subunit n=1 Tax=Roseateles saccharophilus TaxID=304 RepID=A0A4R3V1I8_ROSSA|nr:molybdopterin cofactor-binding domain-containing protein [Roseateles saccharophilus]MDG0832353.1 xanthine dehydrogenase family protein molybdopterin-binding subunit [Roseateles saccharophilus]TCU97048.1 isoquinoline 1-oxidoreductase beta subunit [Roseateles saccharophilus]